MTKSAIKIWPSSVFYLSLSLLWALSIYYLMLTPLTTLPSVDLPSPYSHLIDKLIHFFMFGVFSYLLWRLFASFRVKYQSAYLLISFILTAGYAYLIEYLQSFTDTRSYSFWDLACGILGGGVMLLVIKLTHKRKF